MSSPGTIHASQPKVIHEQAKKPQVSHQAAFGEAKPITELTSNPTCDWIDSESSPFFQIEFRYRSRQLLRLEGYIPDSPVASPAPSSHANSHFESPVASTSNANRSYSATQAQQSPQVEDDPRRLALLRARRDILQRENEIAILQLEIATLEGQPDTSGSGGSASSSTARKVKAEPLDAETDMKRVKQENGDGSSSRSKGKGKEKTKAEVIVLSDSD